MALYCADDQDDEFFGDQNSNDETDGLTDRDNKAKEEELKSIGYLDAYDVSKDVRLQEGFEYGYEETFEISTRIGTLLGEAVAHAKVAESVSIEQKEIAFRISKQVCECLKRLQGEPEGVDVPLELENLEHSIKDKMKNRSPH